MKWSRIFAWTRPAHELWPVCLLLIAVLAPAIALLWFMLAAMRNERFAVRQKLGDVYRAQLSFSRSRIARYWEDTALALEALAETDRAASAFARCALSGHVDGVLILNHKGELLYPGPLAVNVPESEDLNRKWSDASHLEYSSRNYVLAAAQYDALARETTNLNLAARALQAEARCFLRAGQPDSALQLISRRLATDRYSSAVDRHGRLIVPNAELMLVELTTNQVSSSFLTVASSLQKRLADYGNQNLSSSQRRFLMHELQRLSPDHGSFPTLASEELAAQFYDRGLPLARDRTLRPTAIADVWQFATPNGRVVGLLRTATLSAQLRAVTTNDLPPETEFALLAPTMDSDTAFASLPLGSLMPGWRLALSLKDQNLFNAATEQRVSLYLWSGLLVVAAVGILAFISTGLVRRQVALARLKNDLVATVSHELKTPLSSMRVFVDTLLDSPNLPEQTVRDYLGLIARENERLSRLIHSFLSFSRMERKKYAFHFTAVSAAQIINAAVEATRERFEDCRLELQVDRQLGEIRADADALTTVLINLLENAWKFSDGKDVVLGAQLQGENVLFWVKDHGIGISPRETKNIFQRFYQVDQTLSRKGGGCGLGLSIARYIVSAHQGRIWVESQPGQGSAFMVFLPFASCRTGRATEAVH